MRLFLSLIVLISLTGCAGSFPFFSPSDPDGDNDMKGASHFSRHRSTHGRRTFVFDPEHQAWAAYDEKGSRVNTGRASGGKIYCADVGRGCRTIVGRFTISRKGGADCESTAYPIETNGGAPMPYCMHFSSKGYAIHGSNDVPDYNASHGCIRVTPIAAKWLSHHFVQIGTAVVVLPYR